ncbi:signal peptidase I SipW [Rossellomorea sp. KS-H15a]|uniref:signal peptidase I SipW n=1 Tax=Rossellomorea sp. KS-H15a TaxID=2963940 RepID=UPI0020C6B9E5|nr:signal peptidase I [Rossellomorea sp. KS-H15a]UTE79291.1 signal peptidase I [Rossellomorea sp. KS-H15a]
MKKVMKICSNVLTALLFMVFLFMVFVVISSKSSGGEPQFLGYQLKTVLSGSMEPTFKTGSVIAVKPVEDTSTFKKGEVVTFLQQDNTIVTHRIMDVIKNGDNTMIQTKGDNNEDVDTQPVLAQNVIAKYTGYSIPYLGYFIDFAKSNKGTAILLIVPGILLIFYSIYTIITALREIDKGQIASDTKKTA